MLFRQVIHDDLGCASYLVGDGDAGVAAVVDPKLDIDDYLRLARYLGVRIEHVLETHNHADHVSGHGRLAAATGCRVHIHRAADAQYPHRAFDDGWSLQLGSVLIRALHTPGHRPEHTSFALIDSARGPEPWAVLTGDSLFVGDVARPDLAVDKDEGARALFGSLHAKLLSLPDDCEVWPAHLGGSLCGGPGMDLKTSSTIGFESGHNPLLRLDSEDDFVAQTTHALPPQPPNFKAVVAANREASSLPDVDPHPMTPVQVERARDAGALVVDVRTALQFDEAHVPGSVANPAVGAGFGTKLAWIAGREETIVLVGRDDEDALRAARLAAAVGIVNIAGYLAGGMTSWREERREVARIPQITVEELHDRRDDVQVLDVREQREWDAGRIPGSVFRPYHDLREMPPELDLNRPVAVVCMSGQRSAVAASLVQRAGASAVLHVVDGGVGTWRDRGWPVES